MPRAKALYITTAGIAANSPMAVASRASVMPGATTARLVVLVFDMPIKLSMIPQTVPNRPTKGAVAPIVARTPVPRAIARPACASMRESKMAARSLTPSGTRRSERSASPAAAATKRATGECVCASSFSAARRLFAPASTSRPFRAARLAFQSSIVFASHTVQVASEAKASPTMTIFTSGTALRNIPQGDKSRGKADGSKASVMRGGGLDSSSAGSATAPGPAAGVAFGGATGGATSAPAADGVSAAGAVSCAGEAGCARTGGGAKDRSKQSCQNCGPKTAKPAPSAVLAVFRAYHSFPLLVFFGRRGTGFRLRQIPAERVRRHCGVFLTYDSQEARQARIAATAFLSFRGRRDVSRQSAN